MAQSKIEVQYILDDKGSLKRVTTQAAKAAKATASLSDSSNSFSKSQAQAYRGLQGVANTSSNATKNFSKQREAIGGSSGLVGAYAVLASNLFAAQAAFGALSRAAQVDQLREGLDFIGFSAGQNLQRVASGLVDITGAAVSTEQALKSTAMAMSAGFSTVHLEGLTKVAKGASIALGRDMGDALDRLVRGTAKLEPEILDELGIMVKLDSATQKYATQLGVAAGSLTDFQRRQAFLNATIEEGLDKYEDIAGAVDPNPYDQLASSLNNLSKEVLSFFNNTLRLTDAVGFLANNTTAMAGVATALGTSLTRMIAPGMFNTAQGAADSANAFLEHKKAMLGTLKVAEKLPPVYGEALESIKSGDMTKVAAAQDSLTKSYNTNLSILKRWNKEGKRNTEQFKEKEAYIEDVSNRMSQLTEIQNASIEGQSRQASASSIQNAASLNLGAAFSDLNVQMEHETERRKDQINSTKRSTRAYGKLRLGVTRVAGSARIMGAAFATALPYIGLIVTAATILYSVIKDKFFPEDLVLNRINEAKEAFAEFEKISSRFAKSSSEGGKALAESYIGVAGVLNQLNSQQSGVSEVVTSEITKNLSNLNAELATAQAALDDQQKRLITSVITTGTSATTVQTLESDAQLADRKKQELAAVQELNKKIEKENERFEEDTKQGLLAVSKAFIENVELQTKVAEATGRQNPFSTAAMAKFVTEISVLDQKLSTGAINVKEYQLQIAILRDRAAGTADSLKSIGSAVGDFNTIMTKQVSKEKMPFEELESGANGVLSKFDEINRKIVDNTSNYGSAEEFNELQTLIKELEKEVANMNLPEQFEKSEAGVRAFVDRILEARKQLKALGETAAKSSEAARSLKSIAGGLFYAGDLVAQAEQTAVKDTIALKKQELKDTQDLLALGRDKEQNTTKITALNKELAGLNEKLVDEELIKKQHSLAMLAIEKEKAQLKSLEVSNAAKLASINASLLKDGSAEKAKAEFDIRIAAADGAIAAAVSQNELALERLTIEKEILKLKFEEDGVISESEQKVLDRLDGIIERQKKINAEKEREARINKTATIASASAPRSVSTTGIDVLDSGNKSFRAIQNQASVVDAAKANKDKLEKEGASKEEIETANAALEVALETQRQLVVQHTSGLFSAFGEAFAALGPEGALVGAISSGIGNMMTVLDNNLSTLSDTGASMGDRVQAGLAIASGALSTFASISKAASDKRIAGIDAEIAAEKKRDGTSSASLAKIAAMEKKKDKLKRKAFEQDKKMKMASVIMNTASAIMGVWNVKEPYLGPALATAYTGMLVGLGAAQLSAIAGTSYDGGGSISGGATKVSIGNRNNSVDLAKATSPSGELAYARGASGTGNGMTDFTPAFTGTKYRAAGGNTAFMVGEQGPEMFVPDRPGTIVPADETASSQQNPVNVSFNINAVDNRGVEDLLVTQRGYIIGMIREAANAHGESFLETVDEKAYEMEK